MKADQSIYIVVVTTQESVDSVVEMSFEAAYTWLSDRFKIKPFDYNADEALIFQANTIREPATPVFNYRGDHQRMIDAFDPPLKRSNFVKVLFCCPKCGSKNHDTTVDHDGDWLVRCLNQNCDFVSYGAPTGTTPNDEGAWQTDDQEK